MKFTTLLLTIGTLAVTATASSPNPSTTNMHINTAPHASISKSRVTSTLNKKAPLVLDSPDAAMEAISHAMRDASARAGGRNGMGRRTSEARQWKYSPNAVRDASTDVVKTRNAMSGISRRARTASKDSSASSDDSTGGEEQHARRRGMGKARR